MQDRVHITSIAQIAQSRGVARGPLAPPPFAPGRAAAVGAPRRAGAPRRRGAARRRRGPRRVRRGGVHVKSFARAAALGLILCGALRSDCGFCCGAACPVFAAQLLATAKDSTSKLLAILLQQGPSAASAILTLAFCLLVSYTPLARFPPRKKRPAPAADESATRGVPPQGLRPLVLAP